MKSIIKKGLAAAVLMTGFAMNAQAAEVIDMEFEAPNTWHGSDGFVVTSADSGSSVTNEWEFTLVDEGLTTFAFNDDAIGDDVSLFSLYYAVASATPSWIEVTDEQSAYLDAGTYLLQATYQVGTITTEYTSMTVSIGQTVAVAPVPEPETYAMMGIGALGLLWSRRRSRRLTI